MGSGFDRIPFGILFVYLAVFSYMCIDVVTCEKQGSDCANPTHQTNIKIREERGLGLFTKILIPLANPCE